MARRLLLWRPAGLFSIVFACIENIPALVMVLRHTIPRNKNLPCQYPGRCLLLEEGRKSSEKREEEDGLQALIAFLSPREWPMQWEYGRLRADWAGRAEGKGGRRRDSTPLSPAFLPASLCLYLYPTPPLSSTPILPFSLPCLSSCIQERVPWRRG